MIVFSTIQILTLIPTERQEARSQSGEEEKGTPKPEVHRFKTISNDHIISLLMTMHSSPRRPCGPSMSTGASIMAYRVPVMRCRFETFSATARFVHKNQNSNTGVQHAMTKYADMTREELLPRPLRRWTQKWSQPFLMYSCVTLEPQVILLYTKTWL